MPSSFDEYTNMNKSRLHLWNMPHRQTENPGFHMPGHAGARFFPEEYGRDILSVDTTEISFSDDLHHPKGPALLAMRESSRIYGSKETLFVETGSTTGIKAMLASVAGPDSFFLLPRTVHMSVVNTLALLGSKYAFIESVPAPDGHFLFPQTTREDLTAALARYPETTGVLLVSPDYYGQCADLESLSAAAHEKGALLLVDEAHGSHFAYGKGIFPPDAMASGADICVQSLHKTIPALTMASQIHISEAAIKGGKVSRERVLEMLGVFETSSPSFLIAASSEYAISWMERFGREALEDRIRETGDFKEVVSQIGNGAFSFPETAFARDPLRIVLHADPHMACLPDLIRQMEDAGIAAEFADLTRIVLIVSPWQRKEDFDSLCRVLASYRISEERRAMAEDTMEAERVWQDLAVRIPESAMHVRDAMFFARKESLPIAETAGRIAGTAIIPYPPGIPLVWPGERITAELAGFLETLIRLGITVNGIREGKIDIV